MSIEWSSSGLDLHLDWARGRGFGLADALRDAVRDGRLAAGTRLPSTRALAQDLGIARGTVTRAYAELAAEGHLVSRQGAPTMVAALSRPEPPRPGPASGRDRPRPRWDLRPGHPDPSLFPRDRWLAATRRALASADPADLGYGDPLGHPRLRAALADYLGRARGVVASPDRIMVCGGYAHALHLLATVLRGAGARTVAFEDPCLPVFPVLVGGSGLTPVGVPVDGDGVRVDALAALDPPPAAVVVTPAHQYPLGGTLHPRRRAALVEWSRRTGAVVVEDDYDGEFRFDRQSVGALQALAPDRVVYAGTTSKALVPGLRLSWLVLPEPLVGPMRAARWLSDRHGGVLEHLAFAEFLSVGDYDRQVRRARTRYRRRRDLILTALADVGDTLPPAGIAAGLHVLVPLGGGRTEDSVATAAARHSVAVEPLGPHHWSTPGPHAQGLVVGYAAPPDHAFGPAVRALVGALRET